jgi:hypothetical protein
LILDLRLALRQSDGAGLAQTSDVLTPAKDFPDQFTFFQIDRIADLARRASINDTVRLLRYVWRNVQTAKVLEETGVC